MGFSALVAMARCWDSAEPDENENRSISLEDWKFGCVSVADTFFDLLQQSWFSHVQEGMVCEVLPPPSCLNETFVLLCSILKYANGPALPITNLGNKVVVKEKSRLSKVEGSDLDVLIVTYEYEGAKTKATEAKYVGDNFTISTLLDFK